jgi:hypothetical protein
MAKGCYILCLERLPTSSNEDSTVGTYISKFEALWIQAELKNKQKKVAGIT